LSYNCAGMPERAARRAILVVHCRNKPLGQDVDLGAIADNTPGFSGAENDLRRATELAIKMFAHFGMSDNVGPVFYEHRNEHPFLGQTLATDGGTSDATVHLIEQEARRVLLHASEDAKKTIMQHRDALDRRVAALLANETVDRSELSTLLGPATSPLAKPKTVPVSALPDA